MGPAILKPTSSVQMTALPLDECGRERQRRNCLRILWQGADYSKGMLVSDGGGLASVRTSPSNTCMMNMGMSHVQATSVSESIALWHCQEYLLLARKDWSDRHGRSTSPDRESSGRIGATKNSYLFKPLRVDGSQQRGVRDEDYFSIKLYLSLGGNEVGAFWSNQSPHLHEASN
jgi:hypothetical protein